MMNRIAALALLAGFAAAPATAVTYDAFASFDGTQGAGNFSYGYASDTFTNGNLFAVNTNCFISGSVCLQQAANNDVPGVTKSSSTSFQYGSVNVPNDRLLLHPGNDGSSNGSVFVAFTAPTTATYTYSVALSVQDVSPSGVDVYGFVNIITGPTFLTALGSNNPTYATTGSISLVAGQSVGLVFNRSGTYNNDSTGLNFTLSTVPEPATWGLMIAGFGMVGAAARRRKALTA